MTARRVQDATGTDAQVEAGWRERALAAEQWLERFEQLQGAVFALEESFWNCDANIESVQGHIPPDTLVMVSVGALNRCIVAAGLLREPSAIPTRHALELLEGSYRPSKGDHVVYRHWGAAGRLLYVGVSRVFFLRQKAHRRTAPWWPEIDRITVEQVASAAEAFAAESEAIRTEDPYWNIRGVSG